MRSPVEIIQDTIKALDLLRGSKGSISVEVLATHEAIIFAHHLIPKEHRLIRVNHIPMNSVLILEFQIKTTNYSCFK